MVTTKGVFTNVTERQSKATGNKYWLLELDNNAKKKFCVLDEKIMTPLEKGMTLNISHEAGGNIATEITSVVPVESVEDTPKETKVKKEGKAKPVPDATNKQINYFSILSALKGDVDKKGGLNYISWANAWGELKKMYPSSFYEVHEDAATGMPYFSDKTGAFVKVTVRVNPTPSHFSEGYSHTVHLPVMDYNNKAVKLDALDTFAINKAIQRALTKAIAMHGFGLYLYQGEDLPKDDNGQK